MDHVDRFVRAVPILFLISAMSTNTTNGAQPGLIMIPFFHFAGGDHLLFKTWQPSSPGAIGGACIGLFIFAIFERWVHAVSPALIHYLVQRSSRNAVKPSGNHTPRDHGQNNHYSSKSSDTSIKEKRYLPPRTVPAFSVSVDIPRGILYAFQRLLGFALMLAVMTFHAGYILSIIAGLTLGEILFGRARYGVVKDD